MSWEIFPLGSSQVVRYLTQRFFVRRSEAGVIKWTEKFEEDPPTSITDVEYNCGMEENCPFRLRRKVGDKKLTKWFHYGTHSHPDNEAPQLDEEQHEEVTNKISMFIIENLAKIIQNRASPAEIV